MRDSEPERQDPASADSADSVAARASGYLRSTMKHGAIYTLGVVLSRMVGFIMIPVYTRVLTPDEYGVLEMLSLTADVVSMLAGMGIGLALVRYYYFYESEADRLTVASSAALLMIAVFAVVSIIGLSLSASAASAILGDPTAVGLVRLATINLALAAILEIPITFLRAKQKSVSVVTVGMVRLVVSLLLNIVLVVHLRLGVAGILFSSIATSALICSVLFFRLFRETGMAWSGEIVKKLVVFGAPLVLWNLGSFVLHYSDRYFLRVLDSLQAVGLYSLSYKFAMLIGMFVIGPFTDVWSPKALEIERKEGMNAGPFLAAILGHYSLLLVTVALGIALFAEDVIKLVTGPEFHAAAQPVPLLALAMVLFGFRGISQLGAMIRERSDLIARSTIIAAVAVLSLNALLIPRWGVLGAALATALAFGIEFAVMRSLSNRIYSIPLGLWRVVAPLLIAAFVWVLTWVILPSGLHLLASIAFKALGFGVFGLLVMAPGVLLPTQRREISRALLSPRKLVKTLRGA